MTTKATKVFRLSADLFEPYGRIIEYPVARTRGRENLFKILIRQPRPGWRIAYLVVRERLIDRLERHPGSFETFEPVCGKGLLFVARRRDPASIRCFLLDRPVILKKGVWHGVVSLGADWDIKIVENSRVYCEYWKLHFYLGMKNGRISRI